MPYNTLNQNLLTKNRFGKRKSSFLIPSTIKPRLQQYLDQQRNGQFVREDDDALKLPFKAANIRNSKDLYDMLFSSRHENGNNNRHQFYVIPQDPSNAADISLDSIFQ